MSHRFYIKFRKVLWVKISGIRYMCKNTIWSHIAYMLHALASSMFFPRWCKHTPLVSSVKEAALCNRQAVTFSLCFVPPGPLILPHETLYLIYPSTARVNGAPQMILQPASSIFPCSPLPSVHSRMLSSHLFLCLPCLLHPFTVPCKMVLARPDEQETWPYHCSLHLFTMVRSSCGLIACWILARTSSLVTWSLYEMCGILQ